jgi:FkbM family methyltransferase
MATKMTCVKPRRSKFLDRLIGFENVRGHTFYSKKLDSTSTVLDLGANQGAFSRLIAAQHKCRTFAVEASPQLFAQIEESPLIHKYNYAVAGNDGVVTFYESTNPEAGNIVAPKSNSSGNRFAVQARSFSSLIAEIGLEEIDLLKIDIEGAEIQLFDNMRPHDLARVKQLTIEFHDSVPIPNVSTEDVERIIARIVAAGFSGVAMGRKNFDWLFWNQKLLRMPPLAKLYLHLRARPPRRDPV